MSFVLSDFKIFLSTLNHLTRKYCRTLYFEDNHLYVLCKRDLDRYSRKFSSVACMEGIDSTCVFAAKIKESSGGQYLLIHKIN